MSLGPANPANLAAARWYALQKWESFVNDGSSTATANCLLRVTKIEVIDDEILYHVDQPNFDAICGNLIAINGAADVPAGGYGDLSFSYPAVVKLNSGSPSFGDLLGVVANQWLIDTSRPGWQCIGDLGNNLSLIQPGPFFLRGKTSTATWNVDTDLDVTVWQDRDTGTATSPAVTCNVRNRFANITATGDAGFAWDGWQWCLTTFRCPGI